MPSDAQVIFESWSAPIWVNMSLCLAALIYIVGWFRLHTVSPKVISSWRLAAFLCGIISLWIAIGSPLAAFDDVSLTIHMVQHLLLMTVTPHLILLGAPAIPFLQGLPERDDSQNRRPDSPVGLGKMARSLYLQPCDLLAGGRACLDRMARPRGIRVGIAVKRVARIRARILFRRRPSILVAGSPALAEHLKVASMVHPLIPFQRHVAV